MLLFSPAALAEAGAHPGPPAAEGRSDVPAMTNAQLSAFADLVGQPHDEVSRHLQLDSSLLPVAATAAEARMNRKRSGKIRAAVGFGILGVGGIASALLWSSAFSRSGGGYDVDGDRALGAYAAAAVAAVGLGVGISGIVVMARQSQAESDALDRYQQPSRQPGMAAPTGHAVRLRLLSVSF
jgi:hypothetical protein